MYTATTEDIAVLERLAVELERDPAQRSETAQERDWDLRAIELKIAHAVSIVDGLCLSIAPCS